MKKLIALFVLGAGLLVVALVAALFFLGPVIKSGVEKVAPALTQTAVTLDRANLSLFNGNGQLKGFVLGNPEGFETADAVKVGSVAISIDPRTVFADKVVVRSVRVEAPEITYEAGFGGSNIGKILDNLQAIASSEKSTGASTAGKPLQVDEFIITGGKISVSASILGGRSATLPLPEIRLANLGQGPEGITPAELGAKAFGLVAESAGKAVAANAGNLGKAASDTVKEIGAEAKERVKQIGSGLGDLLKSKN